MAQAEILYAGTANGLTIFSHPGRSPRWLSVGTELRGMKIERLACNPEQPLEVVAATSTEVLTSNDGGRTWQPTHNEQHTLHAPLHAITFAGSPPAALRLYNNTIERSEDEAQTWQPIKTFFPASPDLLLAVPYHPDIAFVGTTGGEIWITTDRGRSWQLVASSLPPITALAVGRVR